MDCTELFAPSSHVGGNSERLAPFVVLKGNHCCQASRLNSRERASPAYHSIVECPALCFGVAKFTGIKSYVQHALGIKTKIGILSVSHAAHKDPRHNQQCQ